MSEHPPSPILTKYSDGTATAQSSTALAICGRVLCVRHSHALGTEYDCSVGGTGVPADLFGILLKF